MNLLAYVHLRNIYQSTGAGRTARQITEHLAQRPDIHLEVLADAADRERIVPLVSGPWRDFRYHTFSHDTSRQQAEWFLLNHPKAEDFWSEADIIYCTGESYVPARKAKLVVTAHDAGYFDQEAHRKDAAFWKTRLKWTLLFKKLERKADLFHTVSQSWPDGLAHHFPAIASRIRVVHNGVTPHFFGPVGTEGIDYIRQAGLDCRPYVLVPGGLHYRKNAELILAAVPELLRRHTDLVVAVVNHTDPFYATQTAGFGDRFRLLGFVSDAALHALYAEAAVVWYPSRYEGFGLPVVEAMASGAAVVASNSSSIPEIAGSAALLASPASLAEHLDHIDKLLLEPEARQDLARRGRERARQFTWQRAAAELHDDFQSLL